MDAYDDIGLEYYYLRKIDKAIYYHNRMMECRLEGETVEREMALERLLKKRSARAFKANIAFSTAFDLYRRARSSRVAEKFCFLHDSQKEILTIEKNGPKVEKKSPLTSPKFEEEDVHERMIDRAMQEVLLNRSIRPDSTPRYVEAPKTPTSTKYQVNSPVERLTRNSPQILGLANRYPHS